MSSAVAKNLKITTTVQACITLRNELEFLLISANIRRMYFRVDECQQDYLIKIVQKLNQAISKYFKGNKLTVNLTDGQATLLQKFVIKYLDNAHYLNKEDIFKAFEVIY